MQIRSSGKSYLASSLTEFGHFVDLQVHLCLAIEISFTLRVMWFTMLSSKSFKETENLRSGQELYIVLCIVLVSSLRYIEILSACN